MSPPELPFFGGLLKQHEGNKSCSLFSDGKVYSLFLIRGTHLINFLIKNF